MPRIAQRLRIAGRPMRLVMKDGRLLPESPFGTDHAHRKIGNGKQRRKLLGRIASHPPHFMRQPSSERTDFQADLRAQIVIRERRRVAHGNHMAVRRIQHAQARLTEGIADAGKQGIGDEAHSLRIDGGIELVLLRRRAFAARVRLAHRAPVENQINILGKPFDQTIGLGKAGSALEHQPARQLRVGKQAAQHPAHPEILFHHGRRGAHARRRFGEQFGTLGGGKLGNSFHQSTSAHTCLINW